MSQEEKEEDVFLASSSVDVTFYLEGAMWTIQEEGKGEHQETKTEVTPRTGKAQREMGVE